MIFSNKFRKNDTANEAILANCNYKSWAGNGYCDDPVNTENCGFDLGDCCPKENQNEELVQDLFSHGTETYFKISAPNMTIRHRSSLRSLEILSRIV